MNRELAKEKLAEFDDAYETVEALQMLSVTAEGECGLYMVDAARAIEGLLEFVDEIMTTGIAPASGVTK